MPYRNGNIPPNTYVWANRDIKFIRKNFNSLSNRQLAMHFGVGITTMRTKCYELGLKRMEMEYWTKEQISYLKRYYKKIGDTELTEIFQKKWPKKKLWTKKHIEKKRKYLGLNRTRMEVIEVGQRNLDQGRLNTHMKKGVSNFLTTGPAKQNEIRMYRNTVGVITSRIKIGKRWIYWPRWAWQKYKGPIPDGKVVIMKDGNPFNTKVSNLMLATRAESTRRSASQSSINLSDNYVIAQLTRNCPELKESIKQQPELIKTKRLIMQLKRKINETRKRINRAA